MAKKNTSHGKKKTVVKKSSNPSKPPPLVNEGEPERKVDGKEKKENKTFTNEVVHITSNEEEDKEENMEVESEEEVHEEEEEEGPKKVEDMENDDEESEMVNSVEEEDDKEGKVEERQPIRSETKRRCLVLCSRGVTARYRHLLEDIRNLLPHHKKDAKLDVGKAGYVGRAVNEIAELKSCNSVLFLECRKRADCYMWLSETPQGPSVKFHISNVHTMDELRLTGNCMKGSRPILSFDESFGRIPHLQLLKVLLIKVFGTPKGHPKSKPFVDRVMAFYYADQKIWVRNYQILEEQAANAKEVAQMKHNDGLSTSLVEIGPRFVMTPIRIFGGSFGGQTLYQNLHFVSPNELRSQRLKLLGNAYNERKKAEAQRKERQSKIVLPEDPLNSVFK